jgi:hypothetical protein
MENTSQLNSKFGTLPKSALMIDKLHSCTDCPIRQMAMKQPHSIFARLHAWHRTWWPGWNAHQARACALRANASNRS